MKIRQILTPFGTAARCGYTLCPEYITIHNTANLRPSATAAAHAKYLQGGGSMKEVSYHYVVDEKEMVQCIPDNEVAWHAGDTAKGTGNRKSLAIEICENQGANLYNATQNAVELTAFLMEKYNIPLKNVVQHNHWSGKNCPNRIRKGEPYGWGEFLTNVQRAYDLLMSGEGGDKEEPVSKELIAKQAQRIKCLEGVLAKVEAAVREAKVKV